MVEPALPMLSRLRQQEDIAISSFRPADLKFIDDLVDFIQAGGYVLDFSDRSFSHSFATELDANIEVIVPLTHHVPDPVVGGGVARKS